MPQIPTVTETESAAVEARGAADSFLAALPSAVVIGMLVIFGVWSLLWLVLPFVVWFMWGNLQSIRRNTAWLCQ